MNREAETEQGEEEKKMSADHQAGIWGQSGPLGHLKRPWVLLGLLLFAAVVWHATRTLSPESFGLKV